MTEHAPESTIKVVFEGRVREFPAHYETEDGLGREMRPARLVPDSQLGIRFVETTNGWYAVRETYA